MQLRKITQEQVAEIKKLSAAGNPQKVIAAKIGVSISAICRVLKALEQGAVQAEMEYKEEYREVPPYRHSCGYKVMLVPCPICKIAPTQV